MGKFHNLPEGDNGAIIRSRCRDEEKGTAHGLEASCHGAHDSSRLSAGEPACREESGWVAGGVRGSGRVLGLRLLAWQLERSLELREERRTEKSAGKSMAKRSAKVKILHRRDLERRDKAQIRTDKYSC